MRLLRLALCLGLPACDGMPSPNLERMIRQHKAMPYEPNDLFADGRAMRAPPVGTAPRDRLLGQPLYTHGSDAGRYATQIHLSIDRSRLQEGRERYDVFCAPCHGLMGDGDAELARRMPLRRPPSLVDAAASAFPPGRLFEAISEGYGLMPSYREALALEERWEVVAYLRALARSQRALLADLPASMRVEAERALR